MSNLKKIFKNTGYKEVTSIIVIILIITLIISVVYFKNRDENFDQISEINLKTKLINQFNECFGEQAVTLNSIDLQTLNTVDTRTSTMTNPSKYTFFNNNTDIFTLINNNIGQKLYIYASNLKTRLTNNYCNNVNKNENVRNYNDLNNFFKTELVNFYNIILCCIKKYKKLLIFSKSTNQTYQSISGDLTSEENIDLKNQLYCMLRLKININNPVQVMNDFLVECLNLIVNFVNGTSCDTVTNRSTRTSCYNICGKELTSDTLYGMIQTPSQCGSVGSPLPTFSSTNINFLTKNTSPATQINGYSVNSNAYSFTGNNSFIQDLYSALTSTSSAVSPGTNTSPPGTNTSPPGTNTSPPGTNTSPPGTNTSPPVSTTSPPVSTTSPPVSTTSPPVSTTAPPIHRRRYHHHPMTLPYDIPEMPGPFLPLYSDTYPSNALRDDPYASFHNEDYYISPDNINQGIDINLENTEGNNNFFIPRIILDEE